MYLIYKKTSHISGKFIFFYCRMTIWSYPTKTLQSFLSTPTSCRVPVNLFLTLRILFLKLNVTSLPQTCIDSCQSFFVIIKIFPPPEEQLSKILILKDFWFPSARELQLQKAITPKIKAFIFFFICIFWSPKCEMQMYLLYFLFFVKRKNYFLKIFILR